MYVQCRRKRFLFWIVYTCSWLNRGCLAGKSSVLWTGEGVEKVGRHCLAGCAALETQASQTAVFKTNFIEL